ncbi:family 16 glycoside hydrolase [Mucilaginibacter sp.]|jgi:hypothetical protein|uniref:family 16 glycoside hydrolase n=1 Tax=Mucilaginibacter sp. TaxID=1882438 RepID=UPI0035615C01
MKNLVASCLIIALGILTASAQQKTVKYDLQQMLANKQLDVQNREASPLQIAGKTGVKLTARENDGVAWLNGVTFSNGVIELDIKGKDVLQQSFVGVAFHGTDVAPTEDVIYFRPFNFRAADPVRKIHAVQYESLPNYDWEILREKYNGQYEKAIEPAPKADEWFHAKIVVEYPQVRVFVNGNPEASLEVKMLSTTKTGKLGLWVGNNSDGEFANLTVTHKP